MTVQFTREAVLRLAPDPGSAKSGQDLAQPRKWGLLAADDTALWGECQGSGAKPYQVQVDLNEPAFKCSCPSRKFPCKHGLALLLIHVTAPENVTRAARPAWVEEWHAGRAARAVKAVEKAEKAASEEAAPRDPEAQAKRRAKRLARTQAGLHDLQEWTRDLVRAGIAGLPQRGYAFFDNQARRMVDAQAPGVARLVKRLGNWASANGSREAVTSAILGQLAEIHLLTRAAERFESFPDPQRADLEAALGIPVAADELSQQPAVHDTWQVISQEVVLEDALRVQTTWLFGSTTRRAAMILQFAHGSAPLVAGLMPGTQFEGEVAFYPGNGPRAVVRTPQPAARSIEALVGYATCDEALDATSAAQATCIWLERLCLPLKRVVPARVDSDWYAVDEHGQSIPLGCHLAGYTLLAISGGQPLDLVVESARSGARPLAAMSCGEWFNLTSHEVA